MRKTKHGPKCECVRCRPLQDLDEHEEFYKLHCAFRALEQNPNFISRRFPSMHSMWRTYINGLWTLSYDFECDNEKTFS